MEPKKLSARDYQSVAASVTYEGPCKMELDPYGEYTALDMETYARAAVLQERNRCAELCDKLAYEDTTCRGDFSDLYKFGEAIRKGE